MTSSRRWNRWITRSCVIVRDRSSPRFEKPRVNRQSNDSRATVMAHVRAFGQRMESPPACDAAPRENESPSMGILCDSQIRELIGIEPFEDAVKRPGRIPFGVPSYGHDIRVGTVF